MKRISYIFSFYSLMFLQQEGSSKIINNLTKKLNENYEEKSHKISTKTLTYSILLYKNKVEIYNVHIYKHIVKKPVLLLIIIFLSDI